MPQRWGSRASPAPDIFLEAARRLGVAPAAAIVIEDALAGVEAGKAGGSLRVEAQAGNVAPVKIGYKGEVHALHTGQAIEFGIEREGAAIPDSTERLNEAIELENSGI